MLTSLLSTSPPLVGIDRPTPYTPPRKQPFNPAKIPAAIEFFVVIPAFRESRRLPSFLRELTQQLGNTHYECRVLVVDDGSGSEEQAKLRELIQSLSAGHVLPPLLLANNVGKGGAIRAGWEQAGHAKHLVFVDADGAIGPREVCRLLDVAHRSGGRTAIFGSRVKMLGKSIERGFLRHLTGRFFASLVGAFISPQVYDSQCGIKIIPADFFRKFKHRLRENGFCFDVELLAALLDADVDLREVPIDWTDQPGSKVSVLRDTCRLVAGLFRIRRRRLSWT
jgi:dolichyl-phosphate beta-glucosyltransferase